ncbi:hypothetical protein K438DRAFT_2146659 [Mycena galopus ATCC 62051]|nr:hypothetical protein K438DRAFT_2146659 [Mycena galopus ATCC 62051]
MFRFADKKCAPVTQVGKLAGMFVPSQVLATPGDDTAAPPQGLKSRALDQNFFENNLTLSPRLFIQNSASVLVNQGGVLGDSKKHHKNLENEAHKATDWEGLRYLDTAYSLYVSSVTGLLLAEYLGQVRTECHVRRRSSFCLHPRLSEELIIISRLSEELIIISSFPRIDGTTAHIRAFPHSFPTLITPPAYPAPLFLTLVTCPLI